MVKEISTIFEAELPMDEVLTIKRCRYYPEGIRGNHEKRLPRISIVTGVHGDELEGQYICYALAEKMKQSPEHLRGIVDIYPAVNGLGIDSISRGVPNFELDLNRVFPGNDSGYMVERLAGVLLKDLKDSDLVIDIHASNIFLREVPQARINENMKESLSGIASYLNLDFLWIHPAVTVLEATLAHSLNSMGTPCLVVEMGVGMRITRDYGDQFTEGIFRVMREMDIWDGPSDPQVSLRPMISSADRAIFFINAKTSGIFVSDIDHSAYVRKGQMLGRIIDPLEGEVREHIYSPCDGLVFTLRAYPVVYVGSLVARIMEGGADLEERDSV